jgi:cbb3-type cytochrome oxidase cytochrome c subunit
VNRSRSRTDRVARAVIAAGALLIAIAGWVLSRPLPEPEQHRRHFRDLQQQVLAARESRAARAADRARVMRLRALARTAGDAERAAQQSEAAAIEARLGWGDASVVRAAVLARPIVALFRSTSLDGIAPAAPLNGNACTDCHVAIAAAGYEGYPAPLRTHPSLTAYVGAASPHPPSRVRCVACHEGDEHATTFAAAGHSILPGDDERGSGDRRAWTAPAAEHAMLPAGRTEAACVTCHLGERYQPQAPRLNEAMLIVERGGCYGCHRVAGLENAPRRGPDLRRIGAKLTPDWVRAWLENPRAVKPTTWMPRFWNANALSPEDAAAIEAVTTYLFASAEPYALAVTTPPHGDPARGKALVESVGCLGCHVVGDAAREEASLRRTFGQPLDAVGGKTSEAWLFDWLRDPTRYSPTTRMPNLRLSAPEAADATAYLLTLTRERTALRPPPSDDDSYRAVLRRYADRAGRDVPRDGGDLTGDALRTEAGRVVIAALGCFNCHEIRGFENRRTESPIPNRAVWLDADITALHAPPSSSTPATASSVAPDYGFAGPERARVALALTAIAGRPRATYTMSMPWHVAKTAGRSLVQERNCVGCHAIEDTGGDVVSLVAEPSLGPPLLTPEGSRARPDWLREFLREPTVVRPWLSMRMPTFALTDDEIARLTGYFRAIAPPNPRPSDAPAGATAAAGKELFELLKCQQCHVLGSIPRDQPTSNLAPDLRMAHDRLQPEWIDAWLRDPSAILPGTRMPSFWPDYPQSFYAPLDRNGAAQIRAIREHLLTLR